MTSPLRVLVVEDDEALRELYVDLLSAEGHSVHTAADGREALSALDDTTDLVVTDLNMPKMSGQEFLEELRNSQRLSDLPVLVVTAFPQDVPDSLAGPRLGVLRKPFELDMFTKVIEALVEAPRGVPARGTPPGAAPSSR